MHVLYNDLQSITATDWAIEPRVISAGVVAARTLLGNGSAKIVARVLNYADVPYALEQGSVCGCRFSSKFLVMLDLLLKSTPNSIINGV